MIPRKSHTILVQGITGKQGTFWTKAMQDYGSNVVGGVNPKKAGTEHLGVPVYATARDAAKERPFDISVMFIPPMLAKSAAIDACEAGTKLLVCLTEHIPAHDVMEMHVAAKANGTQIVGPNTAGLVTPGECFVGIMPAFNERVFQPGRVGVISRSGSLGTLVSLNLTQAGMGQSVFYGVGGDPMIGTNSAQALRILDADEKTDAIVLCGEIGGSAEEEAAEYASTMKKPVVAFIAGRQSPPGKKMGHAGAIVAGGKGDYPSKRAALEKAGVAVADTPSALPALLSRHFAAA
ncbi:succinyl-CoA synthetase, NAD(P)-binding, alpha subunit [Candidatus Filomicrobium marinum]|uniref:Succinyl-CoA synthetase, NAD(P)-binding, alpha subunit n=2 Tax=Filomicrobium TaxID=119044 RepID=A0A0D6JJ21_9HYPH|nr:MULTISPECIES: succinate--CoA ligase subunit alpha [Filomicrobium]MCV0370890.1 succinate--CoA ligase subunit alpha [Filomicrobium sp.]CFX32771.1 succinyl-CoA synthetase, NAD(P)-binding, alpha subunit [Candidatus Filomicrobium marinum]CPR21953.1 succinyl-CoA synthetase, NAD(P)-binding, alpha subunit [Candidatus Filomicrobium marinum]SDP47891.1 succinyl-CoA synthetase alpha subunit [Filomicrobium insigne]